MTISNDLYENEGISAFELAKGFTKRFIAKPIDTFVPNDVREARKALQARRKLSLILHFKATTEVPISIGGAVETLQKKYSDKRGKWSVSKSVLSINPVARSVAVPAKMAAPSLLPSTKFGPRCRYSALLSFYKKT